MNSSKVSIIALLLCGPNAWALAQEDSFMLQIPAGLYESFVPEKKTPRAPLKAPVIPVAAFAIDRTPVTNRQFLQFVQQNPSWQRNKVSRLFADPSYLNHWVDERTPGPRAPDASPVVHVSWFAARAYCRAQGKRLPTTYEWEYVAGPEFYGRTPEDREKFLQVILEWYSRPSAAVLGAVGAGQPSEHRLGVQDLHGLIWEWTSDFSSNIASTEARSNSAPEAAEFCGAATLGGKDPSNYASYMRFAFRSSLKGGFSLGNLGFRCARDRAP
ncbi:formylglycine-generating enzyme family protein [Oligoflexus tunisiensis]|uniref:formylglycine-generating enzyme family protein n=1 Tax=Oligoflexus tunisiensis TaxID=708132 RepID=UPI000A73E2E2|nr:formylglycine-generating enzyme family protein [Oligoflexus tunisiensis]